MTNRESLLKHLPIRWDFIRSSGPGGQHVNKVSTGVQLRIFLDSLPLTESERIRLRQLAKNRINSENELVIKATRFRSQLKNREDALTRLATLITNARKKDRFRIPTRPPRRAQESRLKSKKLHSQKKATRKKPGLPED